MDEIDEDAAISFEGEPAADGPWEREREIGKGIQGFRSLTRNGRVALRQEKEQGGC